MPARSAKPVKTTKSSKPSKVAPAKAAPKKAAPAASVKAAKPAKAAAAAAPAAKKPAVRKGAAAKAPALRLLQLVATGKAADAGFEPYHAPRPTPKAAGPQLPTIDALRALAQDAAMGQSPLWGLLPADFTSRTGLTGAQLRTAIEAHPGYDLYYCSAHPEMEAVYHNAWRAPEVTHPQFVELSRKLIKAAGLSDNPLDAISHSSLFATGNLMVATPAVWEQYLAFVHRLFTQAEPKLDAATRAALFGEKPVAGRMTYLALIVARLPGLFLMLKSAKFTAFKIPLPAQEKALNPHLRILREMKDGALEQSSGWMAAAWSSYRSLYLGHVMGKEWLLKHMGPVTPTALHTAMPVAAVTSSYPRTIQGGPRA